MVVRAAGFTRQGLFVWSTLLVLCLFLSAKAFRLRETRSPLKTGKLYSKISDKVVIEFQPSNKIIQAKAGERLSEVALKAGVEINYKCRKGECGTCQVKIDNKWVKACQTVVSPPTSGEVVFVNVKPAPATPKKPSKFFSPASFVEGVINNGAGVIGFIAEALKVDDEFEERMSRENRLKEKIQQQKSKNQKDPLPS